MDINKIKDWSTLTLSNDFMFGKVMQNEDVCKELLESLLHIKIKKLVYLEPQKTIDVSIQSKGVRLDVYVADSDRVFDVEIQTTVNAELAKRARYYQSLIDVDTIKSGGSYKDLKETYVMFICTKDPFGYGLSSYTFEMICQEDPSIHLNDKTHKIFYNASAFKDEKDKNVKAFLEYLNTEKSTTGLTEHLQQLVKEARHNEHWRLEYMTIEMMKQDMLDEGTKIGFDKGVAQGISQERSNIVLKLVSLKYHEDKISEITGLTVKEIQALENKQE